MSLFCFAYIPSTKIMFLPSALYLLLPLGGPRTKHQSTLIGCPIKSWPLSPSIAAWASLYVSYSTRVYPQTRKKQIIKTPSSSFLLNQKNLSTLNNKCTSHPYYTYNLSVSASLLCLTINSQSHFISTLGQPQPTWENYQCCLRIMDEEKQWSMAQNTFRYPVRLSRLRWIFFISPYSANLSWMSSSVASSWTPVTKRIQPSTAVGRGTEESCLSTTNT